jgi:hypothetical protein
MSALTTMQLPNFAIRTLDDDAVDTTLVDIAGGRKVVIGEYCLFAASRKNMIPSRIKSF